MSIVGTNPAVSLVKTGLTIISIIMILFSSYMFYIGYVIQRRSIFLRLHSSLMLHLLKGQYKISLISFAEENNTTIRIAQQFIEKLIVPFDNKIDITVNGFIIYESSLTTKQNDTAKRHGRN